ELAGEGFRRADIVRWKDASGKMLAETALNGPLNRITGTIDYNETDPYMRAIIDPGKLEKIEDRKFAPHNRYLPISQSNIDKNPQLTQTDGY
ncbi:MAG: RagB/SusD family nutrient uptake outer membrane protein, partial [Prevotellaceae bacterium]|nr:RagB/SusD family nutrient uptake outer membrane protein [Prevotellaceae bacterium]